VQEASPTLGDVIRRFRPALDAERGQAVTPAQNALLSALARCHTPALGGHVYRCDRCDIERIGYNGCRSRHCPSCLAHKSAAWMSARADELLPVPYFHVVFTLPKQVAALALGNKKVVYRILFRAAAQTLIEIARDPRHLGANIGFLAILHTWTQTLLFHPHLHCLVPGGGLTPDGSHWVGCRDTFFLPIRVLSRIFRGKFLALLDQAARRGEIRFAGSLAPLASLDAWAAFLRPLRRIEWVVYAKPPFGSPGRVLKYLARYTHRVAISNSRIVSLTQEHVTFRYRDRSHANAIRTMTLGGVEFLRRFLLHLLPKGFVRIRHFGIFANRTRHAKIARCRALIAATHAGHSPPATDTCQIAESTVAAPPDDRCPVCHSGRMRWIAALPRNTAWLLQRHAIPPPDT